ncbi:MAG: hypothetical protein J3K34DRAFT_516427 [Monoraphidium minutum]|nr:MAG: hypothetical protein J3K34DRAFT_516427 [Monoraphidium minutum]
MSVPGLRPWAARAVRRGAPAIAPQLRGGAAPAAARAFVAADRPPAAPGDALADVDTPALLLDLDVFEANCQRLREAMAAYPGVSIRPHAKARAAHKCPEVAALQLKLLGSRAKGVCAQKVSEAEALVAGGITDVLVSNQVVAPQKLRRLARLAAGGAAIGVCVDDAGALRALAAAASAEGGVIDVLVEINAGQDRCGVETPAEAAALAEAAAALGPDRGVRFAGIQAYHGGLQHVRDPRERAAAVSRVADRAAAAVAAIQSAGLACGTVTGGGSGTYRLEAGSGVFTEVQPGSFCMGDADYARNRQEGGAAGEWGGPGAQAMWVLTQVMSVSPARRMAVVDAGLKAVSLDSGPPLLDAAWALHPPPAAAGGGAGAPGGAWAPHAGAPADYKCGGDEHGILLYPEAGAIPALGPAPPLPPRGALLRLQPGHCDPTANLFDWVVAPHVGGDEDGIVAACARLALEQAPQDTAFNEIDLLLDRLSLSALAAPPKRAAVEAAAGASGGGSPAPGTPAAAGPRPAHAGGDGATSPCGSSGRGGGGDEPALLASLAALWEDEARREGRRRGSAAAAARAASEGGDSPRRGSPTLSRSESGGSSDSGGGALPPLSLGEMQLLSLLLSDDGGGAATAGLAAPPPQGRTKLRAKRHGCGAVAGGGGCACEGGACVVGGGCEAAGESPDMFAAWGGLFGTPPRGAAAPDAAAGECAALMGDCRPPGGFFGGSGQHPALQDEEDEMLQAGP